VEICISKNYCYNTTSEQHTFRACSCLRALTLKSVELCGICVVVCITGTAAALVSASNNFVHNCSVIHGQTNGNLWTLDCGHPLGSQTNFIVFANAGECSCDTGLYQVSDVRVWKLQCLISLGMDTAYNSAIIVVYRLEILC
jgi:hypothetical protein